MSISHLPGTRWQRPRVFRRRTSMNKTRAHTLALALPIALSSCFIVSFAVARIFLHRQGDFGAGDLHAFSVFSAAFAVVLLLPAALFAILLRDVRRIHRLWLAIVVGALAGFCWTLLNRWYLGLWFGAWSFPVLYCWIAGGVFGILSVAMLGREKPITH